MEHLKSRGLILALFVMSVSAHAQSLKEIAQQQAIQDCGSFRKYDHYLDDAVSHGIDPNVALYEMVQDKYEMADCIDKRTSSILAWGFTVSNPTLLEVMNVEDYANNHFPSRYMAHTSAEWKEAWQHRDERQPRFTQFQSGGVR
jgi:hypothetical protein